MLVERVNWYLNKGLCIMCNEQDLVQVTLEAILLLLYAWNSCPVPGMDISCSLFAVGCEFAFPIDFSSGKHWKLTSSASTVVSYSKDLAARLLACCLVAESLVEEQRAYHHEYIMRAGQILAFTPLATSSLLNALSNCLLPKRGLTSCSLHSLDLGASALSLKVHPTSWSIAITLVARKRNMLPTCHCTRPSLYPFNRLMGRTRTMDNSTNQSPHTPLKKPG